MSRDELLKAIFAMENKVLALKNDLHEMEDAEDNHLRPLAEEAHRLTCTSNHPDRCGWHWENGEDKWSRPTHKTWLLRVKEWTKKWPGVSHNQLLTSLCIAKSL